MTADICPEWMLITRQWAIDNKKNRGVQKGGGRGGARKIIAENIINGHVITGLTARIFADNYGMRVDIVYNHLKKGTVMWAEWRLIYEPKD